MSGMSADFAPILWFRAGSPEDGEDARRGLTAAGVLRPVELEPGRRWR
jgi:hypothetical protein